MPNTRPPILLAILAATIAITAIVFYARHRVDKAEITDAETVYPDGSWNRAATTIVDADDMARVLSLPYTAGARSATDAQSGVVAHDTDHTQPGINLYASGHDPEAILMDNSGSPIHRWRYRFEDAFPDRAPTLETTFFRRAALLPDGDLIALYQGGGLIRLSPRSELRWTVPLGVYNDFHVLDDGRVAAIGKSARPVPGTANESSARFFLEDFIQWLDLDGALGERVSLLAAFQNSTFAPLLQPLRDAGDILHSNTITILDGSLAGLSDLYAAGNILVSLREVDVIGILDPTGRTALWAQKGPWKAQHQPVLLESGRILLFDNAGADGKSRIYEFDPESGDVTWDYRGPTARPLDSPEAGTVQRLDNGNTLITESEQGRAFEVNTDGEIVWEFASPHRAGPNMELVATLFEVIRLPPETASAFQRPQGEETSDPAEATESR